MRRIEPWRWFFPAALLLAPFNVLVWLAARAGLIAAPGIGSAVWHGREMLFGYSFAVIAGYLLPNLPAVALLGLGLLWGAPRTLWLFAPGDLPPALELALTAAFPVALAIYGVRRFASIRRLRNAVFPLVMAALGVAAVATYASQFGVLSVPGRSPAVISAYVVSLLIMMMGGRLVPTATVGLLRRAGRQVRIPPQVALEAATALGMLMLILAEAAGWPKLAGAAALGVAAVLLVRMAAWLFLHVVHDAEVWPLHLGFLWLALGCALIGVERWSWLELPPAGALHALAAGGIGTVTLLMMARVARYRAGQSGAPPSAFNLLQIALAFAVLLRVGGGWGLSPHREVVLWISAALWTVAYGGTALILLPLALQPGKDRR